MNSNSNPSLQCSVCGQWMRLHGKDDNGNAIQRFHGSCEDKEGNNYSHDKEVCDECCKLKCPYRFKPKDTVIIYFIWWARGHGIPKNWYCAELNGEIQDYHLKEVLIKNAEEKGLPWQVIRYHKKGGKISIIQKSNQPS